MYLNQAENVIAHCVNNNINCLVAGPQGVGKSETIEKIANDM